MHNQPSNAHRKPEPPRPRAARIEVQHAILHLLLRNVAVPVDHGGETRRFRLQIQFCEIVQM